MKRCIKIIISSALLLGCLVLTSCDLGDSISIRYEPKETTAPADTSSTNKPSGDNSASNTPSGDNPTSNTPSGDNSTSNTPSVDEPSASVNYAYKYSPDDVIYILSDDSHARVGVFVDGLSPNTEYQVNWSINSAFMMNTSAYFVFQERDGEMRACIYFDPEYEPNNTSNTWHILSDTSGGVDQLLTGNYGNGVKLSTRDTVDACIFVMFECNYESVEQMNQVCKMLGTFINDLSFSEVD